MTGHLSATTFLQIRQKHLHSNKHTFNLNINRMNKLFHTLLCLSLLMTGYTVSAKQSAATDGIPRAEYPRPQFERSSWINLNGTWTFAFDFGATGKDRHWESAAQFDKQITVPFCPESSLSGVGYTDFINGIWYQRHISIP